MNKPEVRPVLPWWRVRMVWLVLSGPAIVVVAGIVTAVIAVRGADPVVDESPVPRSVTQWKFEVGGRNDAMVEPAARPAAPAGAQR